MKTEIFNNTELIAPCGINCGICRGFLLNKNKCPGCRMNDLNKPVTRLSCKIKTCEKLREEKLDFCFECESFPCVEMKKLDKRYRTNYRLNLIENQNEIKKIGLIAFLKNESIRWGCSECGGTVCVHNARCSSCGELAEK